VNFIRKENSKETYKKEKIKNKCFKVFLNDCESPRTLIMKHL